MVMALFFPFIFWVVIFYLVAATMAIVRASLSINIDQDYPISSSVQLVGVKGLEPSLAPGAVSPAIGLLVRVDDGHIYDEYREGGGVTVSYAGVPLAHGHTPISFRVGAKAALTFTVNATAESVGVPEDLFRLMSTERRWGAAQLEVRMQLGWPGWESYAWSVDLDG
ncbi:unnamed protein product [Urochloa decumbens]|uniref:Late embryogenesis abundant protein LEA-2 subgroup domain-containing protein n=1 Tax=Urochloa decumbens TaxID=240449 RepID=A0ABC9A9F9_9POAL